MFPNCPCSLDLAWEERCSGPLSQSLGLVFPLSRVVRRYHLVLTLLNHLGLLCGLFPKE